MFVGRLIHVKVTDVMLPRAEVDDLVAGARSGDYIIHKQELYVWLFDLLIYTYISTTP